MYVFSNMIDIGLKKNDKWASKAHKTVAQNVLLCNPRINTCQLMIDNVSIINAIPKEKIKKVTLHDLFDLGVMLNRYMPTKKGKK